MSHVGCFVTADIYDELDGQLEAQGVMCECLGGGKIQHNSSNKEIAVSGQSQVLSALNLSYRCKDLFNIPTLKVLILFQGYGKANHSETVTLLKRHPVFSTYTSITWE